MLCVPTLSGFPFHARRPHPLRPARSGRLARGGAHSAGRCGQERPARRPSFLHHLRYARGGVQLSPRMLSQYPKEMTVVLQHQFWDLVTSETAFQVGLSFGGIPERLTVPFAAIRAFFDPSVQFSLRFAHADETAAEGQDSEAENAPPIAERSKKRPAAQHSARAPSGLPAVPTPANPKSNHPEGTPAEQGDAGKAAPAEKKSEKPESGGEVVRLDRFRKK